MVEAGEGCLWVSAAPPAGIAVPHAGGQDGVMPEGWRLSISCRSLLGSTRLSGLEVRVDWLNPSLKQKLQSGKEKPPSSRVQGGKRLGVPKPAPLPPMLRNALDRLNALCQRRYLGAPLFLTKCIQANPNGWLRFWCRVVIPGCPVPFGGFTWVRPAGPGRSGHEEAKVAVALQVLRLLGESLQGVRANPLPFPKSWSFSWECGAAVRLGLGGGTQPGRAESLSPPAHPPRPRQCGPGGSELRVGFLVGSGGDKGRGFWGTAPRSTAQSPMLSSLPQGAR